jgi:hypothetical protein
MSELSSPLITLAVLAWTDERGERDRERERERERQREGVAISAVEAENGNLEMGS